MARDWHRMEGSVGVTFFFQFSVLQRWVNLESIVCYSIIYKNERTCVFVTNVQYIRNASSSNALDIDSWNVHLCAMLLQCFYSPVYRIGCSSRPASVFVFVYGDSWVCVMCIYRSCATKLYLEVKLCKAVSLQIAHFHQSSIWCWSYWVLVWWKHHPFGKVHTRFV